ncbi:MAG: peroxiredoxin [Methylotenera sp.]|jgi:peroxiredoxin|nr:MAG: peroxiredoxin [Methylotenera sp.]HNU65592.1 peroxiredoxin [Methylotenera sp.]HOY87100.1 peroxiredoxin [Methylotenera sp.]HPH07277.1 peroxiredoxin [Methylotenera sp.]HPM49341.1 peroxiredoxin [Methylotenera sp.]
MQTLTLLPDNLPIPLDDGACSHLLGLELPDVILKSTSNDAINLSAIDGWVVLFCYPRTGQPNQALPEGWDAIPGARGCTPQACAFRDDYQKITALGAKVFGLSSQSSDYQKEASLRLHLPFSLLSDVDLLLTDALNLPTFVLAGMRLNKRVTLISFKGIIQQYFYPVFPPDKNSEYVLSWLREHA